MRVGRGGGVGIGISAAVSEDLVLSTVLETPLTES